MNIKFDDIIDSLTNGQRKQALEQIKRLSVQQRWACVEYTRDLVGDKQAFVVAKLAITKEA